MQCNWSKYGYITPIGIFSPFLFQHYFNHNVQHYLTSTNITGLSYINTYTTDKGARNGGTVHNIGWYMDVNTNVVRNIFLDAQSQGNYNTYF